ncbi:hypothetical protein BY996DRAFT_4580920 [Phakopsora pachyrhizi]|uniref:Fe2OG dioxygenase domain-containing protein n=1 Tax=Phakopsora pachyrhizi TaxID=170000 RepID=A0AAV0AD58_PHAPC|nr:hypothetical protein BY996DRAFT_4580920 [Phakopsora pachyrhizi]CAH7665731.1 hypothetical protein PPACK8108_LOCUS13 [Phakopsora pachyrhizi]
MKSIQSSSSSSIDLNDFKIKTPVPEIYLIPNFISKQEESYLSKRIDEVGNSNAIVRPDGSLSVRAGGWQNVKSRRTMQWGGSLSSKGNLLPQKLPSFMDRDWPNVFERLKDLGVDIFNDQRTSDKKIDNEKTSFLNPNHCLVNEYLPGHGISPHHDGPAYFPTVATISLDSHTIYDFYCYADDYINLSNRLGGPTQAEGQDDLIPTFSIQEPTSSFSSSFSCPSEEKTLEDGQPRSKNLSNSNARSISSDPLFSLVLPPRSLIIIRSECYKTLLHSIPTRTEDHLVHHLKGCLNFSDAILDNEKLEGGVLKRERRISLTIRRVERVIKALNRFGR